MKYLKKFEKNSPELLDYVIINTSTKNNILKDFINNHIGRVIYVGVINMRVAYDNIPNNLINYFYVDTEESFRFSIEMISDVVEFSYNREELELKLSANKYNL